jgi:hypothetical protein
MSESETRLDGNAVGGLLRELFTVEMTAAEDTCGSCGAMRPVGSLEVYTSAPGVVIRCPSCQQVLMRIVRGGTRVWLDLTGTRCLEFSIPESDRG